MDATVLVISNNSVSSMGYSAALMGYGYRVETLRTFEGAHVLLHQGLQPVAVIIDVKYEPAEINGFISTLRLDSGYRGGIVVVGQPGDHGQVSGATAYLPRPTNIEAILTGLEPPS